MVLTFVCAFSHVWEGLWCTRPLLPRRPRHFSSTFVFKLPLTSQLDCLQETQKMWSQIEPSVSCVDYFVVVWVKLDLFIYLFIYLLSDTPNGSWHNWIIKITGAKTASGSQCELNWTGLFSLYQRSWLGRCLSDGLIPLNLMAFDVM